MEGSQVDILDGIIDSEPEMITGDVAEEIGEVPVVTPRIETVTLIPLQEEDLPIADYGFIGFGTAGIALIISLGVAVIIRIFWRSAS